MDHDGRRRCRRRSQKSHAARADDDRFCRNCGFQLRDDAQAIEAHLARILPRQIEVALSERLRDQKVVEVETAQKLAERAMGWLKIGGFFLAIPLLLCGIALSLFGFKTYSDLQSAITKAANLETLTSGAEKQFSGIQTRVDGLDADLKSAKSRIDEQITQIDAQQKRLQTEVTNIQERLRFCPTKNLSVELKTSMQEKLIQFIGYLERVGFRQLDEQVSVCIFSKEDPIKTQDSTYSDDINAFYMPGDRTIYMHRLVAPSPSVPLHEYTHHALMKAFPGSDQIVALFELHEGLADYFASSFMGTPLVGDGVGTHLKMKTSYLRNLQNELKYSSVPDEALPRGTVWAGALWSCRAKLGQAVVDTIAFRAWSDLREHASSPAVVKAFATNLAKHEQALNKATPCLSAEFAKREIPR